MKWLLNYLNRKSKIIDVKKGEIETSNGKLFVEIIKRDKPIPPAR